MIALRQLPPFVLLLALALVLAVPSSGAAKEPSSWKSQRLIGEFYAEGAAVGDIDGDGQVDIAYGPFWLAGPNFATSRRFAEGEAFEGQKGYSDNFFSFITDASGDGHNDILVYGFPGKEARLYLNPGPGKLSDDIGWSMHVIADEISNESPTFVDLIPGGMPEIVCTHDTTYGYYQAGEDPTQKWTWHGISEKGEAGGRFEHGLGVGDVDGDGLTDIVQREFWYRNTGDDAAWSRHRWALPPQSGGAQILVEDVDGDGDSDLISSLRAHAYGLAWFEQVEPGKFFRHDLMGESSTDSPYGVCFSQLHALAAADIDGDGRTDFVTGKRHLAHQGKDPGGLQEPVLYWFRNTAAPDGSIDFVPHLIDRDSGVGTEITVADINNDQRPDIIGGNKKGLTIHLQEASASAPAAALKWKPVDGSPQDHYVSNVSAEVALEKTEAPDGFSVDLISAEPDITQPIAMCFDARGRIWVVEGHTYPERQPDGEGSDRIVILEDSDADGSFDKRTLFAEGINLASGIEVGFGGVYVGAAPYLLFYPDKDANDIPDSEPQVLLDGWGYQDTHETLNSFTWGPDGWLYGCHGIFTRSNVGKPGAGDDQRQPINGGVWRFHPVTRDFEIFAHGTSNPWGVEFNEYGDFFISACVIPHFYHLSEGGRYQRQAGQHFEPYTFDDIKTIADHAHYSGNIRDHAFWGDNKAARPPAPTNTSELGGGHAHSGLAIYLADEFPADYRGEMFFHNLHGHRIVRERIERDGSGYVARHRPDFLFSNNHDFVGVGVMLGPDGALYYSDWVDPQTCHHRDVEIWDRKNGRIFRVRYGDAKTTSLDLPDRSDAELVNALADRNAFIARQAQRLLQERAAAKTLDADATELALTTLEKSHALDIPIRLRAFWTRSICGLLTPGDSLSASEDPDEHIRSWSVPTLPTERLVEMAADDFSLVVRRKIASRLQRLPLAERWEITEGLIRHWRSGHDRNIPLLSWYGIEPLVVADPKRALRLIDETYWPQLKEFVIRRAATMSRGRTALSLSLASAANAEEFLRLANQMLPALADLPEVEMPDTWEKAKTRATTFGKNPAVITVLARLGSRFGDQEFFPHWRAIAADAKRKPAERVEAMQLLTTGKDPQLGGLARESLVFPPLRAAAFNALRQHPGLETAQALIARLEEFDLQQRNEAVNLLASRADMALALLQAIDSKKVPASLISPVLLDQFERFDDDSITALIDKNWARGGAAIDLVQLRSAIVDWKKKLSPKVMAKADASRGRQTYSMTCGNCHKLFGEGIALGPDLTGSNRADLGYLLENVLAPSAVVGTDYLLNIFTQKNGSIVSGMVSEETPDFVKVAMPGGATVDVIIADIEKREQIAQSLMPAGLFDALPLEQVADLVKYLGSARQVALPEEKQSRRTAVAPPADGVIRIEAESLTKHTTVGAGTIKAQSMGSFGRGWSGNGQLWWIGAAPGDVLTLKLEQKQPAIEPGTYDLTLFPTTASDYAAIKVTVNGQLQQADLFSSKVLPGQPLHFPAVNVSPSESLQIDIYITGKHSEALPRYMVGIDRLELEKSK